MDHNFADEEDEGVSPFGHDAPDDDNSSYRALLRNWVVRYNRITDEMVAQGHMSPEHAAKLKIVYP